MITTNLVFSEWERIFKDPMTTLAALDRVIHHSVVLDMTGLKSFRAKQAQEQQASASASSKQTAGEIKPASGKSIDDVIS